MGGARARIAIIGCEPKDCIKLRYGNKRLDVRHLMESKIKAFGNRYEPLVHWPVKDIKDFPGNNIDAVVIPGSPLNADDKTLKKMEWMRKLLDFIADVHGKVPMLGICFGHQAIAKTFGADVRAYTRRVIFYEIGFEMTKLTDDGVDDPLFKNIPERFTAIYSHFQYVNMNNIPIEFDILAKSTNHKNKSVQAYKIGDTTYGVQFHPDWDEVHIGDIVKARNAIIMKNIGLREIIYYVKERHDHKIIKNFLDII